MYNKYFSYSYTNLTEVFYLLQNYEKVRVLQNAEIKE